MSLRNSLQELLSRHTTWSGSAAELLEELGGLNSATPASLTKSLNSHLRDLEEAGIFVDWESDKLGQRVILSPQQPEPTPRNFLAALFGYEMPWHLILFTVKHLAAKESLKEPKSFTQTNAIERAIAWAAQKDSQGWDCFFGLGLQRNAPKPHSRGRESGVVCIPGIWIDMDFGTEGHAVALPAEGEEAAPVCPSFEAAQELLLRFPLPPSIFVRSAGGIHGYWLFKDLPEIDGEEDVLHFKLLMSRVQAFFRQSHINPDGYPVDRTHDISRVLRIPGTNNWKTGAPRPVTISLWEPTRRYTLAEIEQAVEDVQGDEPTLRLSKNTTPPPPSSTFLAYTPDEVIDRVKGYLRTTGIKSTGARHQQAWRCSCVLLNDFALPVFGLHDVAWEILQDWHDQNINPPLARAQLRTCFEDSKSYHKYPLGCSLFRESPRRNGSANSNPTTTFTKPDLPKLPPVKPPSAPKALPPATLPADDHFVETNKMVHPPAAAPTPPADPPPPDPPSPPEETGPKPPEPRSSLNLVLRTPAGYPPLRCPKGYKVDHKGVWKEKKGEVDADEVEWKRVLARPLLITDRLKSLGDSNHSLILAHKDSLGWHKHAYSTGITAKGRDAVPALAEKGYSVCSAQAASLEAYLQDFELANDDLLPTQMVSNHLGWQKENGEICGFLLGRTLEGGERPDAIQFVASEGMGDLADGVTTRGSWEKWKELFFVIAKHPKPLLCLYASFAAPLLHILDAPPFVIDLCGETSKGKTTTLRACATVWGVPDPADRRSLIQSWSTTQVAIERRTAMLHNLPIFLDDTKPVTDQRFITRCVYMISDGQGKQRGSLKGLQQTGKWKTVAISTGEARIRNMTSESGKNNRLVTLWGAPFEGPTPIDDVRKVKQLTAQNYGVAGQRWVRWLIQNKDRWDTWRHEFSDIHNGYSQACEGRAEAERVTDYLAVLELAGQLVHEAFHDLGMYNSPLRPLWNQITSEVTGSDSPTDALRLIYEWSCANRQTFWGNETPGGNHLACSGKWEAGPTGTLGLYRYKIDEILQRHNFSASEMLARWSDRGWLLTDSQGNWGRPTRMGNTLVRLITFSMKNISEVCQLDVP